MARRPAMQFLIILLLVTLTTAQPPWAGAGRRAGAASATPATAATSSAAAPMGGAMMSGGMMMGPGGGGMMGANGDGGMMGGGNPEWMQTWMRLLMAHQSIARNIQDTPDGVATTTLSADPKIAALIQQHVEQMRGVLAKCAAAGGCKNPPLRRFDPLFVAIFANANDIDLQVTNKTSNGVPLGVVAKETGLTPNARLLARAHAKVVSDFVARGHSAAMEAHPVPTA